MSGIKGMARDSKVYFDALDKERIKGNERMICHRGTLYSETAVNALYLAVKWFKSDPIPLDRASQSKIRTWLKKRRTKK